jgi:peptidoglycan hydrolase-like protein with peptidoglycan-binding domain
MKRIIQIVSVGILFALLACQPVLAGMSSTQETTVKDTNRGLIPSWPVVRRGDRSINTKVLQYFLKHWGYSITVDGIFGSGTESKVKAFQRSRGLYADGIVGKNTWSQLCVFVSYGSNNQGVRALQEILNTKFGHNLTVDGIFGPGTKSAVLSFKGDYGITGAEAVGNYTWQYLLGSSGDFWDIRKGSWVFPLVGGSVSPYGSYRHFGARRSGGSRAHAGVDLIPLRGPGSQVRAMTSGTVTAYYYFYGGTYALEVKNDDGTIARYGEVSSSLRTGARVYTGQVIGTIPRNTGGSYMLHLEVFKGTTSGSLTNRNNSTYWYVPNRRYQRRADLLDPMGVMKLQ